MPLAPVVRFGGGPQIEELRTRLRSWLAEHLPDEFRRTVAQTYGELIAPHVHHRW